MNLKHIGILFLGIFAFFLISCSPREIREAREVIVLADSMRVEGMMYNDSVRLAKAYETLGRWSILFPTDFAHACYHYGRLLREKDNPVAAMECFINATHTRTHDYSILGRAYSNMGSLCHLACAYPLAYDMYEKSADMFLRNGDTLLYFYGLNNMAFELAEQGKKEEAYRILDTLSNHSDIFWGTTITRAVACKMAQQYDSTIYYTSIVMESGYCPSTVILNRAQAYSLMSQKDSALFYARILLANNYDIYDKCNALYILTNDDDTQEIDDIKKNAADRADAQMLIEERIGKLSQAVQLLEQNLERRLDWRWAYAILVTLVIVGVFLFIYVHYQHKNQTLLTQKIEVLKQATSTIQEQHNELTERYLQSHKQFEEEINKRCSILRDKDKIIKALAWKKYHMMCASVDKQFYLLASKLQSKHCLNETEIRLCVLTLLDCGYDQMAELLYRSSTSIGTLKLRVSKKLGTSSKQLRRYLIDNVCLR